MGHRSDGDFAHSLADLMSGVAVTFLVLAAIFMVQAAKATKRAEKSAMDAKTVAEEKERDADELKKLRARNQESMVALQTLLVRLGRSDYVDPEYDSQKDPYLLTLTLRRDKFPFGSARCSMDGEQYRQLVEALRDVIPVVCVPLGDGLRRRVYIEGHTDNEPLLGGECSAVKPPRACRRERNRASEACRRDSFYANVRLSWERANYLATVAHELPFGEDIMGCLERDVNVAGRGPMEPLDDKPWRDKRPAEANAFNRRVVIKVRISAPDAVAL